MTHLLENERLKKQLEKDRVELLDLQQRIINFTRSHARLSARKDDAEVMVPGQPIEKPDK